MGLDTYAQGRETQGRIRPNSLKMKENVKYLYRLIQEFQIELWDPFCVLGGEKLYFISLERNFYGQFGI